MSAGDFPARALWRWFTIPRFGFLDLCIIIVVVQVLRGVWSLL